MSDVHEALGTARKPVAVQIHDESDWIEVWLIRADEADTLLARFEDPPVIEAVTYLAKRFAKETGLDVIES